MKAKLFFLSVIFSILSTALTAQVSKEQADDIVQRYIEIEINNYYWLYFNENIADNNGATTLFNWKKEPISDDNSCFVYFIDEHPYANWAHPCRYLLVNKNSGQLHVIKTKTPPEKLGTWEMITPLPNIPNGAKFDFSQINPNLQPGNTQNSYAVIISGGYDEYYNWERYWNDCSAIYSTLISVYGYSKNNIYVLMSNGTDPSIDRHLNDGSYDSSPLDLDGDGLPDIQYAATKNDITTVFNTLANILTPDDNLFIFTTGQGDLLSSCEVTLELWHETITASEFAAEVDKVNAGSISVVMGQSFSGGFIPHLAKQRRNIATACSGAEYSWAMPPFYTYNEFVYHWTAAVAGYTLCGTGVNADSNNDGYISMKEAFDYAESNDTRSETPQYHSIGQHLGDCITLYGCSLPLNYTNETVTQNTDIIHCNEINVQYVTVEQGAKLTLEAKGMTTIIGDFEVELGSELEVRGR